MHYIYYVDMKHNVINKTLAYPKLFPTYDLRLLNKYYDELDWYKL